MSAIVAAERLTKVFKSRYGGLTTVAVDDVSFAVNEGESFGIVGESGSGKTTTARMMLGLIAPSAGRVEVDGIDVWGGEREERQTLPKIIQAVFQDPFSSMNPRMRIGRIVTEGLRGLASDERRTEAERLLEMVGLSKRSVDVFPRQLSGGQRQRVAIARALAMEPRIIVADEPVSSLDVSLRGQILNLLAELGDEYGLTTVMVSHDLGVVRQFCSRVIVMSEGQVVEEGDPDRILREPEHSYTKNLVAAIPRLPGEQ